MIDQLASAITSSSCSNAAIPASTMTLPASSGKPNTPMKYDRLNSSNACAVCPAGASFAAKPLITE
ncbi:hypothetical protein D3C81_2296020 [compost metagenome]